MKGTELKALLEKEWESGGLKSAIRLVAWKKKSAGFKSELTGLPYELGKMSQPIPTKKRTRK